MSRLTVGAGAIRDRVRIREVLIARGMIYSEHYVFAALTVPLFDTFMSRTPEWAAAPFSFLAATTVSMAKAERRQFWLIEFSPP